jgi:5-hydroxyisourate hydrolase-like protein (transthyretin family)
MTLNPALFPLLAQKIVHTTQKNVHQNLPLILNPYGFSTLVSGTLVAF